MPAPPRPKRVQIHLSTAVVMMFVAGALIWINIRDFVSSPDGFLQYGWPFKVVRKHGVPSNFDTDWMDRVNYMKIFVDFVVASLSLYATWFVCESIIRRRAARKAP